MKTDKKSIDALKEIFLDKWGIQLNEYEDQYHRTDCWFNWNGKQWDVEIKARRFKSDKYETTIIDKSKFIELCKKPSILVVMFSDCWYIFKDVKKAFVRESNILCPSVTDWDGYMKWKQEAELSLEGGIKYEY